MSQSHLPQSQNYDRLSRLFKDVDQAKRFIKRDIQTAIKPRLYTPAERARIAQFDGEYWGHQAAD